MYTNFTLPITICSTYLQRINEPHLVRASMFWIHDHLRPCFHASFLQVHHHVSQLTVYEVPLQTPLLVISSMVFPGNQLSPLLHAPSLNVRHHPHLVDQLPFFKPPQLIVPLMPGVNDQLSSLGTLCHVQNKSIGSLDHTPVRHCSLCTTYYVTVKSLLRSESSKLK